VPRGALSVAVSFLVPGSPVLVLLHLQDLQGFRIDLGFEGLPLGIRAENLVAAIIDLQPLDLPPCAAAICRTASRDCHRFTGASQSSPAQPGTTPMPSERASKPWRNVGRYLMQGS
jgi:hypothetical protein